MLSGKQPVAFGPLQTPISKAVNYKAECLRLAFQAVAILPSHCPKLSQGPCYGKLSNMCPTVLPKSNHLCQASSSHHIALSLEYRLNEVHSYQMHKDYPNTPGTEVLKPPETSFIHQNRETQGGNLYASGWPAWTE